MTPLFQFENVSKQFSVQFILNNFSLIVNKGEKLNISGRSGIGKTTLFKLMLGFDKPDAGNIYYKNELLNDKLVWELRCDIAYVSQDLSIGTGSVKQLFDDTMTLKTNLQYRNESLGKIDELFNYFELDASIINKNIEGLSGGEKQRVAIVNALLLNRKIFLLDEISSALDQNLKIKAMDYFFKNPDFTVLYISHDSYVPQGVEIRTIKLENL